MCVIKGTCMYSYQGCKNSVFYSKYIIVSHAEPFMIERKWVCVRLCLCRMKESIFFSLSMWRKIVFFFNSKKVSF